MKLCRLCGLEKHLSEFHRRAATGDGRRHECAVCQRKAARARYHADPARHIANARRYTLKQRYGMTQDDWAALLVTQAGRCGICSNPMVRPNEPHVDHCHETKKVRGMLCSNCNTAIGRLGDNVAGVSRALDYLKAAA